MIISKEDIKEELLNEEAERIAQRLMVKEIREALYFPKFFQIETTRLCNARCPFCAVDQWDKSEPFMPDELFHKIVDEIDDYADWIEFVAVQRAGEPLMDKRIADCVRCLKRAGIRRVSISTNGSLLSEQRSQELLDAGLDEIMFSIDSIDKDKYTKMRAGLNYETVLGNIENFFKLRDKIKPDAIVRVRGVSFYDMEKAEQRQELARWEDFWSRLRRPQDRIYMKRVHNWGNQKRMEGYIPDYGWVYHPCVLPWSTMHITAMGKVALCPHDYDAKMNLGDITTDSIAKVWQNERWTRLRQLHASGRRNQIIFCRGCRLFDLDFSLEDWQQKQLYED